MNSVPENLPIFEDEKPELKLRAVVSSPAELMAFLKQEEAVEPEAAIETVPKLSLIDFLWKYKVKLGFGIFGAFVIVYSFMVTVGFLPESLLAKPDGSQLVAEVIAPVVNAKPVATTTEKAVAPTTTPKTITQPAKRAGEDPIRVYIPKIGVDTKVSNPKYASITNLEEVLKNGAVRYPGSAGLGGGNVFIFGHSTNRAVVVNPAYKAFNNFDKLSVGDEISVYSLDQVYIYEVERVHLASAEDIYVDLSINRNMLTLSTCNTFGQKAERYVVEAKFISSALLTENEI